MYVKSTMMRVFSDIFPSLRCSSRCLALSASACRHQKASIGSSSSATRRMKPIDIVCSMGTEECVGELHIFLSALRWHHPTLPVLVGCTSSLLSSSSQHYPQLQPFIKDPHISWIPCLDVYRHQGPTSAPSATIQRSDMEMQPGVWYASRHTDFMMEKTNLMERALMMVDGQHQRQGLRHVAFMDADITLLEPLPHVPVDADLALSPHLIQASDEDLFGKFNGGFVVTSSVDVLHEWRRATYAHTRYFDQASLENVWESLCASPCNHRGRPYLIPQQHNYGYWRLLQTAEASIVTEAAHFSIRSGRAEKERSTAVSTDPDRPSPSPPPPADGNAKIYYKGEPLGSIHTHLLLPESYPYKEFLETESHLRMKVFNTLVLRWMEECVLVGQGTSSTSKTSSHRHIYSTILSLVAAKKKNKGVGHTQVR